MQISRRRLVFSALIAVIAVIALAALLSFGPVRAQAQGGQARTPSSSAFRTGSGFGATPLRYSTLAGIPDIIPQGIVYITTDTNPVQWWLVHPSGNKRLAGAITIGAVTALPAGAAPTVTATTSLDGATTTLAFGIPVPAVPTNGKDGAPGAPGAAGKDGSPGTPGNPVYVRQAGAAPPTVRATYNFTGTGLSIVDDPANAWTHIDYTVTPALIGAALASHTHTLSQITDAGSAAASPVRISSSRSTSAARSPRWRVSSPAQAITSIRGRYRVDRKPHRAVAIPILPLSFGIKANRLARFDKGTGFLAQHPRIFPKF